MIKKFTNKYLNLLKISELDCKIPALIYIDDDEFDYFCKEGHLSINTRNKIESFTRSIRNSGDIPLFSIRCEGKGGQGIFFLRIYASSACFYALCHDTGSTCYSGNGMRADFSLHGQNAQNPKGHCCPITAEIF